jgi:hypothetical protein
MFEPMDIPSGAEYEWPTEWRGIVGMHAPDCNIRDGERCTCGPLGYRSSVHDPISGTRMASPILESEAAAAAWARARGRDDSSDTNGHLRYTEATRHRSLARREMSASVEEQIEDFLAAAADGRARDPSGRRYSDIAVEQLSTALEGHVALELGSMPLGAVRPWQVQAFVNELSDSGLSPARLRAIVAGLRALYAYAIEEGRVHANPVDRIIVPVMEDRQRIDGGEPQPFTTTDQLAAVDAGGNGGFIPEQVLWQLLKVVTVVFILIALILAAESI